MIQQEMDVTIGLLCCGPGIYPRIFKMLSGISTPVEPHPAMPSIHTIHHQIGAK